mmetsp:Transcript_129884/g.242891  ORF Transcript_129884/g.242891 Transcript_129884/m.242891 type:complete len:111 (-) Transcript_129884:900-1232(-)
MPIVCWRWKMPTFKQHHDSPKVARKLIQPFMHCRWSKTRVTQNVEFAWSRMKHSCNSGGVKLLMLMLHDKRVRQAGHLHLNSFDMQQMYSKPARCASRPHPRPGPCCSVN